MPPQTMTMRFLPRFVVVCLLSWPLRMVDALFPAPENGLLSACPSVACLIDFIPEIVRRDHIIVAVASVSFALDPYLSLYLGNVIDTFSASKRQLHYLLFEWHENNMAETMLMLMSLLPEKSIVVVYEDGMSAFGMYNMAYARVKLGLGTAAVLHLNHEQPWVTRESLEQDEATSTAAAAAGGGRNETTSLPTMDSLVALSYYYQTQRAVFRNYFYDPIDADTVYFPTGVPFYGNVFGNASSPLVGKFAAPASARRHLCHFTGRVSYPRGVLHAQAGERKELMDLAARGTLAPCTIDVVPDEEAGAALVTDDNAQKFISVDNGQVLEYHKHTYEEYVALLADTALVLCPAGNNPETFRHYEALEAGAVPLFVRPPPDKDYTRYGLWAEYPGPVFASWADLKPFVDGLTPAATDALQAAVAAWYGRFKVARKQHMAEVLDGVFGEGDVAEGTAVHSSPYRFPFWGDAEPSWSAIQSMIADAASSDVVYTDGAPRNSHRGHAAAASSSQGTSSATAVASASATELAARVGALEAANKVLLRAVTDLEKRLYEVEHSLHT